MAPPTQKNRYLAISTQLGDDKLLLRSVTVNEQMGRLFQIDVELDSQDASIKFEDIVGTNATVRMTLPNGNDRYFNGVVSRFVQDQQGTVPRYRATLSPWLWLLTRTTDCRIFQNLTVPAIVEQVFKDQGFTDYKLKLSGTYNAREYCVQYRETAFNFVSRLMEQAGIYYFFQHQDGKHILILADSPSAHDTFTGYDTFKYLPINPNNAGTINAEAVNDWIIEKELQPCNYVLRDYNFTTPKADLTVNDNVSRTHTYASFQIYDYPGGFPTTNDGTNFVKARIQELQSQYEILRGSGTIRGVATGFKFKLTGHPRRDQSRDYIIISSSLQATAEAYASGAPGGTGVTFSSSFAAIPTGTNPPISFKTPRTTPRPFIRGPQTAIVVGSSGTEIDTDQYGRVKLHFLWDRHDSSDQNSSCWVRVSQNWAGKEWGSIHLPRVGQEVIVEFLEGDPDYPIITGRVYNADQKVPYTLPANKTQSGIKSRSTTGGSTDNFNELRFEDKKGSEQIFIQAEKDLVINVKNNSNETITNDRTETVSGKHTETISKDRSLTVSGKETKEVDDTLSLSVTGNVTETFKAALSQTVTKDVTQTFQGGLSQTVTNDVNETFNAGHTEKTTNTYTLQADTISITGQTKITLTVGGNSITIDSSGITINSSASLSLQGSSSTAIKGATVSIN